MGKAQRMSKKKMTVDEFLANSNTYPLQEGGRNIYGRGIPPDIELIPDPCGGQQEPINEIFGQTGPSKQDVEFFESKEKIRTEIEEALSYPVLLGIMTKGVNNGKNK